MSQQQLQQIIQMLKAQPIAGRPTVEDTRANFEQMASLFPVAADVKCEPVNAGGVKAEWVTAPGADAGRAVLYLHGGGYVIGSINTHRDLAARISRAAKARVLLIDYRLAPEHPFPAAVEDSVAAYRWMLAQGLKASRIVVAGDSAGGGLTVATLVAIRDAKLATPAAGACLSPWTDLEGLGDSMKSKASVDPMVQKEALLEMAKHYLAGQDARSPLAAPLYADLAGLPPLLIQVGDRETVLADSTMFADKARAVGVDVELQVWDGMIHVFQMFAELPDAHRAIASIAEFLKQHLQMNADRRPQ